MKALLALVLAFVVLVPASTAHDAYSSWVDARLLSERLELTLVLSRANAHALLPDAGRMPAITPDTFPSLAPRLRELAPELLPLTANGKALKLASAQVKLSDETDVTFVLSYARPAPGPLRFFAQYLGHLVDGHVATVAVSNGAGDDLGWSPVSLDQPYFQIVVLPAADPARQRR